MSSGSSNEAAWSTRLERVRRPEILAPRADDPRLAEVIAFWQGDETALKPGRPVLIGFPQDEGVRRNRGRPGAAEAPTAIRHWLHRLVPWDGEGDINLADNPPLDLGNVRSSGNLEDSQQALGEVVAAVLKCGAVPVVMGGGHETAYGHYLGHVGAGGRVGIINLDAHLDVRPWTPGQGHSGSPFRQALEHPTAPLAGPHYVCLGAQPQSVSRAHLDYARRQGCVVRWQGEVRGALDEVFGRERDRLAAAGCSLYVSLDADVADMAEVPGVSAPNVQGLSGRELCSCARLAGRSPQVASFDLVEINPRHDRDGQSSRWAALVLWHFLIGLASRPRLVP